MLPVMARMQGPGLLVVAPLIATFFLSTWMLAVTAFRAGWVGKATLAASFAGPVLAAALAPVTASGRIAGLGVLGCFAAVQIAIAVGLAGRGSDTAEDATAMEAADPSV